MIGARERQPPSAPRGSFWPSETQAALIRVAFSAPGETAAAWTRVRPQFELDRLETGTFALLPVLYRALARGGVPEPQLPRLKGIYRSTWYRNTLLLEQTRMIVDALADAGIRFALVAGIGTAFRFYGGIGLRPTPAVELLLARREAQDALRALERLGWGASSEVEGGRALRVLGADGHACLLRFVLAPGVPADILLEDREAQLEQLEIQGVALPVLSPAQELLAACVTGGRAKSLATIQWLVDVLAILRTAPQIDWQRIGEHAVTMHQELRLLDTLTVVSTYLEREDVEAARRQLTTLGVPRRQRLAHLFCSGAITGVGGLPLTLGEHLEETLEFPAPAALRTLPRFLQRRWGLEHERQVPLHAVRRARAALGARRANA